MSLLGKYLDDFLHTYDARHEAQRGEPGARVDHAPAEHPTLSPVDPQPAPALVGPQPAPDRRCAHCGDMTARVYLVMNGGWMLCSRCYRQ
jgi:hypothetical protein